MLQTRLDGVSYTFSLIGSDCPLWCEDNEKQNKMDEVDTFPRKSHIHGKHYRFSFTRKDSNDKLYINYWNSYADEEQNYFTSKGRNWPSISSESPNTVQRYRGKKPVKISVDDVLSCI